MTDHEDLGVATKEEAFAAAAARARELFSQSDGVVMLLDGSGKLIWSKRCGMPRPGDSVGF
ncbi:MULTISPECIES: hypothetical protein [unclassified Methylobacterium]|uniref:hypothetical protein n=1 Tax=unclassified Methylobacterium TaxID=2615210 RepID=UPI001F331063|nr:MULTISPECIES: hypothetical protein [Methylobacterium]WFT81243.1 hypothetical protein QA634_04900 [Methylobacterium nodulans]